MTSASGTIGAADCARDWDVIVIGAGPAGALAAREAARGGAKTLLVERKPFPRSKVCGACLNRSALSVLEAVGLGEPVRRLPGLPVHEFHVRSGGRGLSLPLPEGLAVARDRFDAALASAAVDAGAAFLTETTAAIGDIDDDVQGNEANEFRRVSLRDAANKQFVARARIILAADGLGHTSLDAHAEFASRVDPASRIGLGGVVADFPAFYRSGTIFMGVGRAGYVGLVRVNEHELNVAAAVDAEFIRVQHTPAAALATILAEAGFPPVRALDSAVWQGTLPLTRRSLSLAGRRVLLLGDAAGYVEPFTGEGMAWALAAAAQSAPFVRQGLENWNRALELQWSRQLRRLVTRRQRWCRCLSMLLRHPRLSRGVLAAISLAPRLARPVIRGLNAPPLPVEGIVR